MIRSRPVKPLDSARLGARSTGAAGMKTILIIGIGAGDPEHVTMQAVKALNRVKNR